MWTYNSQATLEKSLDSIERALPESEICHKIMVDGGSTDDTERIAHKHGWDFYQTRPGIPVQANYALRLVDRDIYASFEHDIVLTPIWLKKIERLLIPSDVVVAQGIRLSKGSTALDALDRWSYLHGKMGQWFYSIDNNLYKTAAIRKIGGYPQECPMTADGLLRRKILSEGMRWVTDPECVSWHLRSSFPSYLLHAIKHIQAAKFLWQPYETPHLTAKLLRIFLTSPVAGAKIASESHTPLLALDYPLLRYVLLVTMSVLARSKKVVTIPAVN